jgi:hypothetical protein
MAHASAPVDDAPQPSPLIAASAAYQATHWLSQFYPAHDERELREQVRAGLQRALDLEPQLLSVMKDQLRLKGLASSPDLSAAMPTAARVPGIAAQLLSKRLNAPFFAALVSVLAQVGDRDLEVLLARVVDTFTLQFARGLDLAHPRFQARFWERTPLAWNDPNERQGSPFYRAAWPDSHFDFLCDGTHDLALDVVARSMSAGPTFVEVNEHRVGALALSTRWTRSSTSFGDRALRHGLNRITLRWPQLAVDEERAIDSARRRFGVGADADLFPVFGEVYSLVLRQPSCSTAR